MTVCNLEARLIITQDICSNSHHCKLEETFLFPKTNSSKTLPQLERVQYEHTRATTEAFHAFDIAPCLDTCKCT